MRTAVIPKRWIALDKHQRLTASFWITVAEHIVDNNLGDTDESVKLAIAAVEKGEVKRLMEAKELRRRAYALLAKARELESGVSFTPERGRR